MKWNKDYTTIIIGYLVLVLYMSTVNNKYINILLVLLLFVVHIIVYRQVNERYSIEKQTSILKLQNRLDKTKKQQEFSNERFMSLSQSFGSGLLMVDADGIIQYANKDMKDFFQKDFDDTDYKTLSNIPDFYKFINQAYLVEKQIKQQITHQGKHFELISTPLFEDGLFQGALILAHDITSLKNAEEYQKRFTADVSHELRTPLSAIKGFSEILSRGDEISEEDHKEFLQLIQKESERMEVILRDLMVISKLDRIDYEPQLEPYDIARITEDAVALMRKHIEDAKLELIVNVEPCILNIDTHKILQVLLNLIKNAISYTDQGSITITGKLISNEYVLSIQDTGIGIKPSDYDKIFKRFYRVDKARSRDTGGSGLGLSISKNAIKKHGGTIRVESEVQKGTTFIITLPIVE